MFTEDFQYIVIQKIYVINKLSRKYIHYKYTKVKADVS